MRAFASAALPLLLLAASGCIATRAQVAHVEDRITALEKQRALAAIDTDREAKRLENLRVIVEESSDQLRESLAKSSSRLSDIERSVQRARGEIEVLLHRLEAVEKSVSGNSVATTELRNRIQQLIADLRDRAGISILALPAELPPDAAGFVALAEKTLAAGDSRVAAAVANECQKRFPGTEEAGACGLVLGRIALEEQRYVDAMRILQAVHDGLNGKPVPVVGQALLDIANVLELQGRCARAAEVLKYLRTEMPKVPAAKVAKDRLATAATRCKEGVSLKDRSEKPADAAPSDTAPAAEPPAGVEKAPDKPAEKPADKPADKVIDKAADKPTDKPVDKVIDKPAEKVIDKAADRPADKVTDKLTDKTDVKPVVAPASQETGTAGASAATPAPTDGKAEDKPAEKADEKPAGKRPVKPAVPPAVPAGKSAKPAVKPAKPAAAKP
ncbi:MAG: hypothetical protein ACOYOB_00590 [Myxococcota bacterium]